MPSLTLNGRPAVINEKGIILESEGGGQIVNNNHKGILSSNQSFINIINKKSMNSGSAFTIETAIGANGYGDDFGINFISENGVRSVFIISKQFSNTFKGDINISGKNSELILAKINGAIAVNGSVNVSDHAKLTFLGGGQSKSASVNLIESTMISKSINSPGYNSFKEISISGRSIIGFSGNLSNTILFDEFVINNGSGLNIIDWVLGRTHILVKKNSVYLNDALKKIRFVGYEGSTAELRQSYWMNRIDYWEIVAAPEPATYGAILGVLGLGVVTWRKRRGARRASLIRRLARALERLNSVAYATFY